MYGCESWTVKKAERLRIDAFELWCWRRLLRVPWTARRSNQSILKGDQPWDFFGGNDAKAEIPVLWPPYEKSWLIGKDYDAGRCWGQGGEGDNRGWDGWMASPTQWMFKNFKLSLFLVSICLLFEHMEYSYNIFFQCPCLILTSISVFKQRNDYSPPSESCFIASLHAWLYKTVNFILLGSGCFCISTVLSLALFWHVVMWIRSDRFGSCFCFSFGWLEAEVSLGLTTLHYWG